MNASKEEARKAAIRLDEAAYMLDRLLGPAMKDGNPIKQILVVIQAFIEAAERKLPTEAAYAKDRKRRKQTA